MSSTACAADTQVDGFDHLKTTYFEECAELLDSVYAQLAALEAGSTDEELVHAIFRAVHSIKGGGGAFRFARMVAFAHVLETLLDLLRDNRVVLSPALLGLLLRATDALADLIAADRGDATLADGFESALLAELEKAALMDTGAAPRADAAAKPSPVTAAQAPVAYAIGFHPRASLFQNANEPLLLLRELQRLGDAVITADLSALPALERMEPEDAYIGWTIALTTAAPLSDIEEIFDFVTDHCALSISAQPEAAASAPACVTAAPAAPVEAAPQAVTRRPETAAVAQSVRVDVEKVDRLVNLVGEMVINQAMLLQLGGVLPPEMCPGLIGGLETLSQHLRELQEGVMAIRTQPVKSVFSRMPRLVRELSAQLGKDVRLVVTGEGTEIDKTMIEQLSDPLTHLLRNALDHGVEMPDERLARGKPQQGIVHLSAEHRSGRIVIELSDDGRGIDRGRVLARARQRGLIDAGAVLTDEEIDDLIFLPGFSTVDVVSDVSGRGVGMDVVRRNIQALGGRVTVQSRAGAGSRFVLSLPLTLAILDGMIVAVGRQSYIVPLTNIVESLRPKPDEIHAVVGCGDVVAIRGAYIPLLHLGRRFRVQDAVDNPALGIVVVVETDTAGQIGLVVDELVGQQQVVVKSLEANYGAVEGVGGATILGDGRVALILDVAGLRAMGQVPGRLPAPAPASAPMLQ